MIAPIITITGLLFFLAGVAKLAKNSLTWSLIVVSLGTSMMIYGIETIIVHNSYSKFQNELAKEVDPSEVPVRGNKSFVAEITITYKDGEIEKLFLSKGTTIEANQ